MIDRPDPSRSRPCAVVRAAVKAAAEHGMEVEIRPDGTVFARPAGLDSRAETEQPSLLERDIADALRRKTHGARRDDLPAH